MSGLSNVRQLNGKAVVRGVVVVVDPGRRSKTTMTTSTKTPTPLPMKMQV
eukprot:CAMPEP_0115554164 /NCGR_PEP_ID=MMETSP0271-20121206/97152_1 /TAXON_ID=71861 /ORGANISM="Scrippsiella trochoidea, Strain CCMP3099" /LENGTH=49 /DNA_ID=CAMNT_0002987881 /DNA_START=81 /DNA_END=230 /DNA_ORIENTATION=-